MVVAVDVRGSVEVFEESGRIVHFAVNDATGDGRDDLILIWSGETLLTRVFTWSDGQWSMVCEAPTEDCHS
jgi:hypothetical protein